MLTHVDYRLAGVNSLRHGGDALEAGRNARAAQDFDHARNMFAHAAFYCGAPQADHVRAYYAALERGSRAALRIAIQRRDA